jgi:methionyl-tRNA formyltransferase
MGLRVGFMGTPDFALGALKAIHESGHEVVCVYSQPPRPKGRGQHVQNSPVHEYADAHGIPVFTPKSLKPEEAQTDFAAHNLDVAVVAAYGLLLPKAVLDAPKHGCINIHGSLLPRWRGASPIQRAIWEGDTQSGITLMQMDEGLDTGAEIAKTSVNITSSTTASSLHDELCALGAGMIVEALNTLDKDGKLASTPQSIHGITYAHLLKKQDGQIDWTQPAAQIDRQIRALNPWPGTFSGNIKIKSAEFIEQATDKPAGTLLDKSGAIVCGGGSVLKLLSVQPENKKPMDFSSALNGGYLKIGDLLA